MLIFGSQLIGTPVMGLQTGTQLGQITRPLIDPANLKIVAYTVEGPLLDEQPSFIRIADIREYGDIGMIIDSSDEFIGLHDVVKIEELYGLNFNIVGMGVVDDKKHKLGKVEDYSVETDGFVVQQFTVKQGMLKSLTESGLLIHRSQIVEINDKNIIVRSAIKKIEPVLQSERRDFVNPFRSTSPQAENREA